MLHTGNTTVPAQIVAATQEGGTTVLKLPFNTSLLVYPDPKRVTETRFGLIQNAVSPKY